MRKFIVLIAGILLGWQFGQWMGAGTWNSIPISALIPGDAEIQRLLCEAWPSTDLQWLWSAVFEFPLWLAMTVLGGCTLLSGGGGPTYSEPEFFVYRVSAVPESR